MRKQPTEAQKAAAAARRERFRTIAAQVAAMSDEQVMAAIKEKGVFWPGD